MGSKAKPMGSVPEKADVQNTTDSSAVEEETIQAKADSEEAPDVTEDDLKDLQEQQKVPYSRFKEKNDEAKNLKMQLAEAESRYKQAIVEREAWASAQAKARPDDTFDLDVQDPKVAAMESRLEQLTQKLSLLETQTGQERLSTQVERLQSKYPEADVMAVLGWKKQDSRADLEDLMELSHNKNVERVEKKFKEFIEKKKQKAKAPIPALDAGFKIKDSERPKNVKEAGKLLRRLIGS